MEKFEVELGVVVEVKVKVLVEERVDVQVTAER